MRWIGLDGSCMRAFMPCSARPPRLVPLLDVLHTAPADTDEIATVVDLATQWRAGVVVHAAMAIIVETFGCPLPAELARVGAGLRATAQQRRWLRAYVGGGRSSARLHVEVRSRPSTVAPDRLATSRPWRSRPSKPVTSTGGRRLARGGTTLVRRRDHLVRPSVRRARTERARSACPSRSSACTCCSGCTDLRRSSPSCNALMRSGSRSSARPIGDELETFVHRVRDRVEAVDAAEQHERHRQARRGTAGRRGGGRPPRTGTYGRNRLPKSLKPVLHRLREHGGHLVHRRLAAEQVHRVL